MHDPEYNCDRCPAYVPDGDGYYISEDDNPYDGDRVCQECYDKATENEHLT